VDPSNRVLLVRFEDPTRGRSWWATPGGAVDAAETDEQALRRELYEELGLRDFDLGPWIWSRSHVFKLNDDVVDQQERIYLVRSESFSPTPTQLDTLETMHFRDLRWWTVEDLTGSQYELAPRKLPQLVEQLLREGPPRAPIEVGV
jgi:8-oxo-dGTP pyrophosphatase MutT (NUDIX family)